MIFFSFLSLVQGSASSLSGEVPGHIVMDGTLSDSDLDWCVALGVYCSNRFCIYINLSLV